MIWLIIWAKLKSGFSAALSVFGKYPWQCLCLALLVATALLWQRGDRYRDRLLAVQAAQTKAGEQQAAVNHIPAAKSQAIAEKSDAESPAYYEAGRRAGIAYADAHRLRAVCPVSGPDLPRTDRPAAEHDGAGDPADMVAVSAADFDLCTSNSARLAKVREAARSLIDAGVAVESNPAH